MKIAIEEKDETMTYRPVSIDQHMEMVKLSKDRIEIYVPNLCGGETRITVYRTTCPNGNEQNIVRLKKLFSRFQRLRGIFKKEQVRARIE